MIKLLTNIYEFFRLRKVLFYTFLVALIAFMGWFAMQVRFEENIAGFLPDTKDAANASKVFANLKVKDKIIVMIHHAGDQSGMPDTEALITAATTLGSRLNESPGPSHIKDIFYRASESTVNAMSAFVYDNLPLFLTDEDYLRFDSLLTQEAVSGLMRRNYNNLLSPAGVVMKDFIMRDPLDLASNTLKHLQDFQLESNYELIDGYIFSTDAKTLFMFITPVFGTGNTGNNDILITALENSIADIRAAGSDIEIEYFGGPSVAVYNARQIKKDTIVTGIIALIVIIIFISLVFKRKSAIPLIIIPALFGSLFALCLIFFIKGTISAIAVGAGSIVMGIALSYSIHLLAHQNHVNSVQQLIREIANPLTIGSFTTIGAFTGLLFTTSALLRDFGLYASLVLIGTTLFCLIFLPHFLRGQAHVKQGKVLRFIEKINSYHFERNKWLVASLAVLTIICYFTARNVGFNEDMMVLNYEPEHIKEAERKLTDIFAQDEKNVLFVSIGKTPHEATANYRETNNKLSQMRIAGEIVDYASAGRFFITQDEQQQRLQRWHNYWTAERIDHAGTLLLAEADMLKFSKGSFNNFFGWLTQPFALLDYNSGTPAVESADRLLSEWQTSTDSLTMLITQVRLRESNKEAVYNSFRDNDDVVIFDRAYFTNKWVSTVNDDFYLILYISSLIVFLALWLSYGRIELTLISFLPMMISWIIIIGIMGILGIQFNIINIILSTFIFGIGDDFSIFIMDGLQSRYRTGHKVLNSHKTAIFFSAFTMIAGMGALLFARHPALQSISVISILGMLTVVLVAYTIQPVIFNILIAKPASKGLPPYTLFGLIRTVLLYLIFIIECLLILLLIPALSIIPIKKKKKKLFVCHLMHYSCRILLAAGSTVKKQMINTTREDFSKPAIIIANHQSLLDIVVLLSYSPRIVMITKKWVWEAPLLGAIIRYVDFYYSADGYEILADKLRKKVDDGYSIVIFPEGTRTVDGKMKRFHKGAFYLSAIMKLDILPVLFYANHRIISREQPLNVRRGIIATQILPRISPHNTAFGLTYQERTKRISAWMRSLHAELCRQKDTTDNPFFYETLIRNYIYKGPVEEWYMRIKIRMEKNYWLFNELVPPHGQITDIGCGYGSLSYMLAMLSPGRNLLGIDYDEDKIAVARHAWLSRNVNAEFVFADALQYDLPQSNVFILNDMLHYMDYPKQQALLTRCASRLLPGGMIILREGNSSDRKRHRITRITEMLSTRITGFNKTTQGLTFTSQEQIRDIAQACNMKLSIVENGNYTSNTVYIIKT